MDERLMLEQDCSLEELFAEVVPPGLRDPVTGFVLRDPVTLRGSGKTFSRSTLAAAGWKDPMTQQILAVDDIVVDSRSRLEVNHQLSSFLVKAVDALPKVLKSANGTAREIVQVIRAVNGRTDLEFAADIEKLLANRLALYRPDELKRIASALLPSNALLVRSLLQMHSWHSKAAFFAAEPNISAARDGPVCHRRTHPNGKKTKRDDLYERATSADEKSVKVESGNSTDDIFILISKLPERHPPVGQAAAIITRVLHRLTKDKGADQAVVAERSLVNRLVKYNGHDLENISVQLSNDGVSSLKAMLEVYGWHSKATALKARQKLPDCHEQLPTENSKLPALPAKIDLQEVKDSDQATVTVLRFSTKFGESMVLESLRDLAVSASSVRFTKQEESNHSVCVLEFLSYDAAREAQEVLHGAVIGGKKVRVSLFRTKETKEKLNLLAAADENGKDDAPIGVGNGLLTDSLALAKNANQRAQPCSPNSFATCIFLGSFSHLKTLYGILQQTLEEFRAAVLGYHRYRLKTYDIIFAELADTAAGLEVVKRLDGAHVDGSDLRVHIAKKYRVIGQRQACVTCTRVWVQGPHLMEKLDRVFANHRPFVYAIDIPLPFRGFVYFLFRSHADAQKAIRESAGVAKRFQLQLNIQSDCVDIVSSFSLSELIDTVEGASRTKPVASNFSSCDREEDLNRSGFRAVEIIGLRGTSKQAVLSHCDVFGPVLEKSFDDRNVGGGDWRAAVLFSSHDAAKKACEQLPAVHLLSLVSVKPLNDDHCSYSKEEKRAEMLFKVEEQGSVCLSTADNGEVDSLRASGESRPQPSAISLFLFTFIVTHHQHLLDRWCAELGCHLSTKKRAFNVSGSPKARLAFQHCVHDSFSELREPIADDELQFLLQPEESAQRLDGLMSSWTGIVAAQCCQSKDGICIVFAGLRQRISDCRKEVMAFRALRLGLRLSSLEYEALCLSCPNLDQVAESKYGVLCKDVHSDGGVFLDVVSSIQARLNARKWLVEIVSSYTEQALRVPFCPGRHLLLANAVLAENELSASVATGVRTHERIDVIFLGGLVSSNVQQACRLLQRRLFQLNLHVPVDSAHMLLKDDDAIAKFQRTHSIAVHMSASSSGPVLINISGFCRQQVRDAAKALLERDARPFADGTANTSASDTFGEVGFHQEAPVKNSLVERRLLCTEGQRAYLLRFLHKQPDARLQELSAEISEKCEVTFVYDSWLNELVIRGFPGAVEAAKKEIHTSNLLTAIAEETLVLPSCSCPGEAFQQDVLEPLLRDSHVAVLMLSASDDDNGVRRTPREHLSSSAGKVLADGSHDDQRMVVICGRAKDVLKTSSALKGHHCSR